MYTTINDYSWPAGTPNLFKGIEISPSLSLTAMKYSNNFLLTPVRDKVAYKVGAKADPCIPSNHHQGPVHGDHLE